MAYNILGFLSYDTKTATIVTILVVKIDHIYDGVYLYNCPRPFLA